MASQATTLKPLISVNQAAQVAGIGRSQAYVWAHLGELPGCVQVGGRYYVRTAALQRWLDGN